MSSPPTLLDELLQPGALRTLFQPIFAIGNGEEPRMVAVECLTRGPRGTTLEAPDLLFDYALRKRQEAAIDRAAIATACATAVSLPSWLALNVNVHASTLGRDPSFPQFLADAAAATGIESSRLVVEIVEHADFVDEQRFLLALDELRAHRVGVALDDVGLGQSNFRMILIARPQTLKIDRYLVAGVSADPIRREILASLQQLGERLGSPVVAEGVELAEDLEVLVELRIPRVQGYLLGRPTTAEGILEQLGPAPAALAARAAG